VGTGAPLSPPPQQQQQQPDMGVLRGLVAQMVADETAALRAQVSPKRLVIKSPWSQLTRKCRRFQVLSQQSHGLGWLIVLRVWCVCWGR
jgi:hypothetical protein